jgi:hypothetical protein
LTEQRKTVGHLRPTVFFLQRAVGNFPRPFLLLGEMIR